MPGPTIVATGQALDLFNTMYGEFELLNDVLGVAKKTATHYKLRPQEGPTKHIMNYGRVSAYSLSDGVDYGQAQALSDADTTASPGEVGVLIILAGRSISRSPDADLAKRAGRIAARALDLKQDTDGVTQLASFTSTALGGAGTVGAPGLFHAGAARLGFGSNRSNPEPVPEPWYVIHHDNALSAVAGKIIPFGTTPSGTTLYDGTNGFSPTTGSRTPMSDDIMQMGVQALGRLGNATIYRDANLIPDSNDDVTGAMFSKEGLIYVEEVSATMDYDQPKRLRGGMEIMTFASYAWTNYRPANYGIPMTLDATTPTG